MTKQRGYTDILPAFANSTSSLGKVAENSRVCLCVRTNNQQFQTRAQIRENEMYVN